ncbi:hypothetical protein [Mycobacterium avium]|uniref:hypothetical protein n=1 Tax=Mycobacterium avium TaxID=1764 RepID=UPI003557CAE4|nr:hypothetical protein [Mycobacterium avium subsp. hominissuis]
MNAASKPSGLEVGSTRPLSRAERRAQAARVQAEEAPAPSTTEAVIPPKPDDDTPAATSSPPASTPHRGAESPAPPVQLKSRQRKAKNPFATQLHSGTLARLEWIKARGYVITDTVDDAINTYLDNAGIPRPDHNDRMP